jgi:glycosyltransferase involved in cell wall biosynthesis
VTTPRSFFDKQVEALSAAGVDCTVLEVPGAHDTNGSRSIADYLRYYPTVLESGLDDFDVVHAHYGLVGPFALAQPTRPVVLTLWGSDLMMDEDESVVPRISRLSALYSDEVILPWASMSDHLDADHRVLRWGIDTDLFRPIDRDRARERLGWDPDGTVVLFPYPPGREVKNYPLAEAVVDDLDADVTLRTMAGAPYDEVPYYMNASDAVLVTSRRESGPMVVEEAMACNVPVVSTDVGSAAALLDPVDGGDVREGEQGLADALRHAVDGPGRSDGRAYVTDLAETGEELRAVYRNAIENR